jgi:hypothetical protein
LWRAIRRHSPPGAFLFYAAAALNPVPVSSAAIGATENRCC